MIRVLIVDDSPTMRSILSEILTQDPDIHVIGQANDGEMAVNMANALRPDVITMDIFMPKMNGYEAARRIMATDPIPILVISSGADDPELEVAFHALQAGALEVLPKPTFMSSFGDQLEIQRLIRTVKTLAEVRVVKRRFDGEDSQTRRGRKSQEPRFKEPKLVAIASSTGGPAALNEIFSELPASFPLPIVTVQHIADGFLQGLVQWLQTNSILRIVIAEHGARPQPGTIYFAPTGKHLLIGKSGKFEISDAAPVHHVRPSASVLFDSISQNWNGAAIGVILTGMGTDGALALKEMRAKGAAVIAQDEETSVVYGMPRAAVEANAVDYQLPIKKISGKLIQLTRFVPPSTRAPMPN